MSQKSTNIRAVLANTVPKKCTMQPNEPKKAEGECNSDHLVFDNFFAPKIWLKITSLCNRANIQFPLKDQM